MDDAWDKLTTSNEEKISKRQYKTRHFQEKRKEKRKKITHQKISCNFSSNKKTWYVHAELITRFKKDAFSSHKIREWREHRDEISK
jgi:hypothetical protein